MAKQLAGGFVRSFDDYLTLVDKFISAELAAHRYSMSTNNERGLEFRDRVLEASARVKRRQSELKILGSELAAAMGATEDSRCVWGIINLVSENSEPSIVKAAWRELKPALQQISRLQNSGAGKPGRKPDPDRDKAIHDAVESGDYPNHEKIGDHFDGISASAVSHAHKRHTDRLKDVTK